MLLAIILAAGYSPQATAVAPMIAVEESHSLALAADGSVWAWGDNTTGQLGDGTRNNHASPVRVTGLDNVLRIAAGGAFLGDLTAANHSVAVRADGSVWTWGSGGAGQLGDGALPDNACNCRTLPRQVGGLAGVVAAAAGSQHTVALRADGTVWSWGDNSKGQLGDGSNTNRSSPVPVSGLANVVAIAAGHQHTVALKADGTVWAWGNNAAGTLGDGSRNDRNVPVPVVGLTGVSAISAGAFHTIALKSDGTVSAWGLNSFRIVYGALPVFGGQLGDGGTSDRLVPVPVPGFDGKVVAIAAGAYHTTFLTADGSVWGTGNNTTGQLGDGTTNNRLSPVRSRAAGVAAIAAASYHTLALKPDGGVWAWGNNGYGELGSGDFSPIGTAFTTPIQVVGPERNGWLNLLAGGSGGGSTLSASFTLKPAVLASGHGVTVDAGAAANVGGSIAAYRWRSSDGQTASGRTATFSYSQAGTYAIDLVVADAAGATAGASAAITLPVVPAKTMLACNRACFALFPDGTLQGWGDGRMGQLALETENDKPLPVTTPLLANVAAAAAGIYHTLALKSDGSVWAWGGNSVGQLGNLDKGRIFQPAPVAGLGKAMAIAAGFEFSLALLSDGSVWAWGWNFFGQLGDGQTSSAQTGRATPAPVRGLAGITAIAAGGSLDQGHALAVRNDGSVWAWGSNNFGQLGDGSATRRLEPVPVSGLTGAVAVAAGESHSLALHADGTVWAWGGNVAGQLGDGSTVDRAVPVQVRLPGRVQKISAGTTHSAAIDADGRLWVWGGNKAGQLGRTDAAYAALPVLVDLGLAVREVTAGVNQTVAELADGTVVAWGGNEYGQLGDGTYAGRPSPLLVLNGAADGFLDLVAEGSNLVAADKVPPFIVVAAKSGGETATTLSAELRLAATSAASMRPNAFAADNRYHVYVAARVPQGNTLQIVDQWLAMNPRMEWGGLSWPLQAFLENVAAGSQDARIRLSILRDVDLSRLIGAEFYVGYGRDGDEMLRAGRYRKIYTVAKVQ